jgi:LysM repeat protein
MGAIQRRPVPVTAFSVWLRTGRRGGGLPIEVKFNPWHDREDGRFTFVGQGNYFPRGGRQDTAANAVVNRDRAEFDSGGGLNGGGGASGSGWVFERDPADPGNYTIYTVRPGDTLRSIAATRKGLRVSDLARINKIDPKTPLRAGQLIKLWNQDFIGRANEDRRRIVALGSTVQLRGSWPLSLANLSETLDTNWTRESRNGYDFQIDVISRTRLAYGEVSFASSPKRSRRNQAQAGGVDRRPSDDGGHFIAARFNGPGEIFNHFAQDANFNRGAYRKMEDDWAAELRARRRVFVSIKPLYAGTSTRPYHVSVTWSVDGGRKRFQEFSNEPKGKPRGTR